jgi:hypothetical protein
MSTDSTTRIFISYSRHDEDFARRLATSLSDMGADVWIDVEDIPAPSAQRKPSRPLPPAIPALSIRPRPPISNCCSTPNA